MAKRKITPEEKLNNTIKELNDSYKRWHDINEHGCDDPFWPDGTNMNLVRNHILYERAEIKRLCDELSIDLPLEYNWAIPPEVKNNYMANLDQDKRAERLRSWAKELVTEKIVFDEKVNSMEER